MRLAARGGGFKISTQRREGAKKERTVAQRRRGAEYKGEQWLGAAHSGCSIEADQSLSAMLDAERLPSASPRLCANHYLIAFVPWCLRAFAPLREINP
jgi:hypothetical protein